LGRYKEEDMPSTVIGIIREMVYFWEMFNLLLQPRCSNPECGSYDLEATGEIKVLPSSNYLYANFDVSLPGASPGLSILHGYRCNKCKDISLQ